MPTSSSPSPPLLLPRKVRKAVERWSRSAKLPHRIVERARIVALACQGCSNAGIARLLGITEQTARKWRERMRRMVDVKALNDLPRSGRPGRVPVAVRCEVIRLACERPNGTPQGKRLPFAPRGPRTLHLSGYPPRLTRGPRGKATLPPAGAPASRRAASARRRHELPRQTRDVPRLAFARLALAAWLA